MAELRRQRGVVERMALRMRNVLAYRGFASWADTMASNQRLRRAGNKIVRRWSQQQLAIPFGSWAENAAARKRVRRGAQAMLTRWANLRLAAPYESWVQHTRAKVQERAELEWLSDQRHLVSSHEGELAATQAVLHECQLKQRHYKLLAASSKRLVKEQQVQPHSPSLSLSLCLSLSLSVSLSLSLTLSIYLSFSLLLSLSLSLTGKN